MKCVILPSIPTSAFADIAEPIKLTVAKISFEDLVNALRQCDIVVNYIRHPPTNQLLSKHVSFTTGTEYRISAGDAVFVVGLKARAPISGQDVSVTVDDLLILAVSIG
jgi:hypothetical protein